MSNIYPFTPKQTTPPTTNPRKLIYQCPCGSTSFEFSIDFYLTCLECGKEKDTGELVDE